MNRKILAWVPVLAMGLVSGCGDNANHASKDVAKTISVFSAPADVVIAKLGPREITVGDFRDRLAFETGLYKRSMMRSPQRPSNVERALLEFEETRLGRILPQLFHCALLENYLEAECGGLEVDGAEREFAKFLSLQGKKAVSAGMDGFAAELGVRPEFLKDAVLVGLREQKAYLHLDPAYTNVTAQEIEAGLKRLDDYTARAVASNALARTACSNALQRVKGGADFAETGRALGAEDTEELTDWGWFNRDDIDRQCKDPAFKRWAFKAKVGDIGGPFDVDDGLSIVKVLDRQEGTAVASMASQQAEEVHLARINFVMYEENPEPRTVEHCRASLLAWKRENVQKRLFERLFKETKVEYPNGDQMDFRRNRK